MRVFQYAQSILQREDIRQLSWVSTVPGKVRSLQAVKQGGTAD